MSQAFRTNNTSSGSNVQVNYKSLKTKFKPYADQLEKQAFHSYGKRAKNKVNVITREMCNERHHVIPFLNRDNNWCSSCSLSLGLFKVMYNASRIFLF